MAIPSFDVAFNSDGGSALIYGLRVSIYSSPSRKDETPASSKAGIVALRQYSPRMKHKQGTPPITGVYNARLG
jgi:hypothetical protein